VPAPKLLQPSGWLLLSLILAGCGGIQLAEENPADVDLSGTWHLDARASDRVPDLRNHLSKKVQRQARRASRQGIPPDFVRGAGSGLSFIRHDFQVLSANKVDIEQNRDSMGVRHYPGVYRDISWGERQRGLWEVRAGWEDKQLVVMSKANDLHVVERYSLQNNKTAGDRLEVLVVVTADDEDFEFRRIFDRRSSLR